MFVVLSILIWKIKTVQGKYAPTHSYQSYLKCRSYVQAHLLNFTKHLLKKSTFPSMQTQEMWVQTSYVTGAFDSDLNLKDCRRSIFPVKCDNIFPPAQCIVKSARWRLTINQSINQIKADKIEIRKYTLLPA